MAVLWWHRGTASHRKTQRSGQARPLSLPCAPRQQPSALPTTREGMGAWSLLDRTYHSRPRPSTPAWMLASSTLIPQGWAAQAVASHRTFLLPLPFQQMDTQHNAAAPTAHGELGAVLRYLRPRYTSMSAPVKVDRAGSERALPKPSAYGSSEICEPSPSSKS